MKFKDIPKFTSDGNYTINIPLEYIKRQLENYDESYATRIYMDLH